MNRLTDILSIKQYFTGLEYFAYGDDAIWYATQVCKKKKEIERESATSYTSIKEVSAGVKSDPVWLVVHSPQVITKFIREQGTPEQLVQRIFPDLNPDEFYLEVRKFKEVTALSICRKTYVDQLLNELKGSKINSIGFSLGPQPLSWLLEVTTYSSFAYNGHELHILEKETRIEPASDPNKEYDINGIHTSGTYLLSLGAALAPFFNTDTEATNFGEVLQTFKSEHKNRTFFKNFARFAVAILLVTLLINFFVFNHYYQKTEALQQTLQVNDANRTKLLKLNEEVTQKQKLVEDMIASSSSRSSFYLDQIISLMPSTLLLNEVDYQPIKKRVKENEEILVFENQMRMYGTSVSSEDFSTWIEQLERLDFTNTVEVINYGQTGKTEAGFALSISLRDE
ncbi:hypothetical protein [Ascidiimonas aurantiaca]|uniref:hypothetical protein n=1 Tax=Ascidiimonas aurantiaca TaxID=1685432 RepID=UPI0030EF43F1